MNTPNKILMKEARESLKGRWNLAIKASLVYLVIQIVLSIGGDIGTIISLIIAGPLALGIAIFSLSFTRNDNTAKVSQMFEGFNHFGKTLITYILMVIYILLWSLLLIIPGIIASIAYSQTFFILAENPNIGSREAIKRSREMMKGYKWKYFYMGFRFLGWGLLSILTLGIGFIWLTPYIQVTMVKFYEDIKNKDEVKIPETPKIVEIPSPATT